MLLGFLQMKKRDCSDTKSSNFHLLENILVHFTQTRWYMMKMLLSFLSALLEK